MKLIFIHGRAQGGKNQEQLRDTWVQSWQTGLNAAGLDYPQDWDIRLPYYGDLLDQLVQDENKTPATTERGAAVASPDDERLLHFEFAVMRDVAQEVGAASEPELQAVERGPLNWEIVHRLLQQIDDRMPGLAGATLRRCTRDVYYYLTNPHIRRTIDELVLNEFSGGACVVVGHSLGSVVGYNVLHQLPAEAHIWRFVTVGSPLGINAIISRINPPIRMPASTDDWFNAFDERDVVALRPLAPPAIQTDPLIRNKPDVANQTDNRHGIYGYLSDPVVAKEIRVT
jgi:hypothetical protein